MDISFPDILTTVFDKHKKDYLTITKIKKSLPKAVEQILGLQVKKLNNKEFIDSVRPLLPDTCSIHKKGNRTYLVRAPVQNIILSYVGERPPMTIRKLYSRLPFQIEEMAKALNTLTKSGDIHLQIITQTKDFGVQVLIPKKQGSSYEIKEAYDIIRKDKHYVKIYELRRYLKWPDERFNSCIQSLWDAGVIELQASDPQLLDQDQRKDSFMDKTRTMRILLIWRGE